ncbi:UPF0389 protein CG9231 [Bactrocera dorsalis]|uniref:UPF0389 protein CG9231 n=2 Tax=Endopterygota TaxID=33392 RepID=A0A034WN90_BACDO|nr:UPF0389 protein CG9231 [Bactrocera dorsalis]
MFGILNIVANRKKYAENFKIGKFFSQETGKTIHGHTPNNLEKRFLVWSGKYKSIEEVPSFVSYDVMERSRNKVRIRVANIMIALTVLGCCLMVYSGKQAAKSGDSVVKQNLDWHKKYNEESKKA